MDILSVKGAVVAVLEATSGTGKTSGKEWKKQSFVIETQEQYPKKIAFDTFKDDVMNVLSSVVKGEVINVCFDIDSHEYNGKWFTNINAYKVEREAASQPQAPVAATAQPAPAKKAEEKSDELPF